MQRLFENYIMAKPMNYLTQYYFTHHLNLFNESPDGASSEISKTKRLDNLNGYEVTIVDYLFYSSLSSRVGKHVPHKLDFT